MGGDTNLYEYVSNNPISLIDALGLRPLNSCEKDLLSPYIPEVDLNNADLHVGLPWWVRLFHPFGGIGAITLHNDIYFAPGQYDAGTNWGLSSLGHELVHVGQWRRGELTYLKYALSSPFGYDPNSRFERAAYDWQYNKNSSRTQF